MNYPNISRGMSRQQAYYWRHAYRHELRRAAANPQGLLAFCKPWHLGAITASPKRHVTRYGRYLESVLREAIGGK
jgi:hypothetical protein